MESERTQPRRGTRFSLCWTTATIYLYQSSPCPFALLSTSESSHSFDHLCPTAHQNFFCCCCLCCFFNRCSIEKARTWKLLRRSGKDETKSENLWSRKRYSTKTLAYVVVHFILESLSTGSSEGSTEGYVTKPREFSLSETKPAEIIITKILA